MAHQRATQRRSFLDLARRRARPGSGSGRDFLLRRTWNVLNVDVARLQTPFVIVGGVATALYMPQRVTLDVDILVLTADAGAMHRELERLQYSCDGPLSIGGTRWVAPDGRVLDVLEADEPWTRAAVERPRRAPNGEPVIALPYLVLMKLAASRPQDLADLSRMLGTADDRSLAEVRGVVRQFRPMDCDDLESLIQLGRLELEAPE